MKAPMLELAGIQVGGVSVGGFETCIDLPRHKLCFDLGRAPDAAVLRPTVLFTHTHLDHLGNVAWHAGTRALRGMPPPTYLVPRERADDVAALFEVWRRLDGSELPCRLVPIGPGEEFELGRNLVARPFRSPHTIACQGYALWRKKHGLAPEYQGLPQEELARLARAGTELSRAREEPEVVFTGDTTIEVVEQQEVVRKARLLVLEVTILDERVPVEQCRAFGHVHLDEVIERADLFENEALLFTHFSARYRAHEVREILARRLPPGLKERVTPLLT